MPHPIKVNRAPVLTLWAAVVAERLGFDPESALTLGRAMAGYTAQAKGQGLGIYHPKEPEDRPKDQAAPPGDIVFVGLMGRALPAVRAASGVRALAKDKPADPASVRRYLASKFGENLGEVWAYLGYEDLSPRKAVISNQSSVNTNGKD